MNYSYFLGVDISKAHLDFCLLTASSKPMGEYRCENTLPSIKALMASLPVTCYTEMLICAEHTGMYGFNLAKAAQQLHLDVWMENPVQIKLSGGMQRGKSDPLDAERIAQYAQRFSDHATLITFEHGETEHIAALMSERRLLVADRAKYKAQLGDQKGHMPASIYQQKAVRLKELIALFDEQIQQIEQHMGAIIRQNASLAHQYELLQSIPGVGPRLACYILVVTQGFTKFANARSLCCHAGVAPFSYHSGTKNYPRGRVSHRADKQLKTLLHMAALSVVQRPGELQTYYQRKVEEGKPKMSVLNAVRSKLVHRMFAVIKHNKEYSLNY